MPLLWDMPSFGTRISRGKNVRVLGRQPQAPSTWAVLPTTAMCTKEQNNHMARQHKGMAVAWPILKGHSFSLTWSPHIPGKDKIQ